jgi:hypothetical protein
MNIPIQDTAALSGGEEMQRSSADRIQKLLVEVVGRFLHSDDKKVTNN